MIYGDEKIRHMARSILPSTRRKGARFERVTLNRRVRRKVSMDCHRARYDDEYAEDFVYDREPSFRWMVRDRQEADKLSHFEKWALAVTKDIEGADARYTYMRSILPPGLIGWHAMSHLENYDAFERNPWRYRGREYRLLQKLRKKARPTREELHERRCRLLYDVVVTPGGHKLLNRYMVQKHRMVRWVVDYGTAVETYEEKILSFSLPRDQFKAVTVDLGPKRPRLLRGTGDIEKFLKDLGKASRAPSIKVEPYTVRTIGRTFAWGPHKVSHTFITEYKRDTRENPEHHPEWWSAMDKFIDAWEKNNGEPEAVRRELSIL